MFAALKTSMTPTEIREAVAWLASDARYLSRCARAYRAQGKTWIAEQVRANAANSINEARKYKSLAH